MSRTVTVDLFAEDEAHVRFCRPLIERIAAELDMRVTVGVRSSRGGIGAAQSELKAYIRALAKGLRGSAVPDLLCVAVDANCEGHAERRRQLELRIDVGVVPNVAFLCPDPHVERWFLSDASAFAQVVGSGAAAAPDKCERALYKRLLREAVRAASQEPVLGGIEFGEELAQVINLYEAGKAVPSLAAAVRDVRQTLLALKPTVVT